MVSMKLPYQIGKQANYFHFQIFCDILAVLTGYWYVLVDLKQKVMYPCIFIVRIEKVTELYVTVNMRNQIIGIAYIGSGIQVYSCTVTVMYRYQYIPVVHNV